MLKCWSYEMMFRNCLSNGIELLKRKASPILIFVMTAATAGGPWKLDALEMGTNPLSQGWTGTAGSICKKEAEQPSLEKLEQRCKAAPEGCCGGHS